MARQFSKSIKHQLALKCIHLKGSTFQDFAKYHGVGYSTLRRWVSHLKQEMGYNYSGKYSGDIAPAHKQEILDKCQNLEGTDLGAFCRRHGLYLQQILDWRGEMTDSKLNTGKSLSDSKKIKALERQNRKLQRDLREAQAIIELQKKVDALFRAKEDN